MIDKMEEMTKQMDDKFLESDRHYISLLQDAINRMATNSANCKTWLITLIAAILALQITADDLRGILWIALGLIILFYILDSYYLSLERKFRRLEKAFVNKEKGENAPNTEIYSFDINSVKDEDTTVCCSMRSPSTRPFYLSLFFITLIVCLWPCISKLWS